MALYKSVYYYYYYYYYYSRASVATCGGAQDVMKFMVMFVPIFLAFMVGMYNLCAHYPVIPAACTGRYQGP